MYELEERALRVSPIHFASAVRHARRRRGISRRRLARACGLSRRAVSEIEKRRHRPTEALLDQLSIGLGADLTLTILNVEHLAEIGGPKNLLPVDEPPEPQPSWRRRSCN
jgi:transcriptional regulator with XRE-family HTH domain